MQDVGWQSWTSNGDIAGTVSRAKRIEAIKIRLTGGLSNYFDVWYRAYCQDFGWLDWTSNGQPAGTSKIGYRIESVQVTIVPKGAGAPGSTGRPYTDQPLLPADMMAMLNRLIDIRAIQTGSLWLTGKHAALEFFVDSAGRGVMLNTGLALPAPLVLQRLRVSIPSPARATRLDMGILATTIRSFTGTICSIRYRTTRELLTPWTAE